MGTVGAVASGVAVAGKAVNLINQRKQTKTAKKNMFSNYVQTTQNRKNLLDQQLASRRARLGAAGLASSPSALAAQNRDIKKTYQDISHDADRYQRNVRQAERDYRASLISGGLNESKNTINNYDQGSNHGQIDNYYNNYKKDPNQQLY